MLEKIALMDAQIIRAALLALASLIGLILSYFGVDEKLFSEQAARIIDAVLLLIATGSTVFIGYARAVKPTPPITDAGVIATVKRLEKESQPKEVPQWPK